MTDIELPYVTTGKELKEVAVGMAQELLWRLVGYDERPVTEDDVAVVLAALNEARSEFMSCACEGLWPCAAAPERPQLRIVEAAG